MRRQQECLRRGDPHFSSSVFWLERSLNAVSLQTSLSLWLCFNSLNSKGMALTYWLISTSVCCWLTFSSVKRFRRRLMDLCFVWVVQCLTDVPRRTLRCYRSAYKNISPGGAFPAPLPWADVIFIRHHDMCDLTTGKKQKGVSCLMRGFSWASVLCLDGF